MCQCVPHRGVGLSKRLTHLAVDGEGRAGEPPGEADEVVDDGVGRRVAPGAGADVGGGDEVAGVWGCFWG